MKKAIKFICMLLCVASALSLFSCGSGKAAEEQKDATVGDFSVIFVNVGYGDCAIVSGGGCHYMIDTGSAESVYSVVCALNFLGIDRIDGVFLTHSHKDHIGGLGALKSCTEIGTVYSSEITLPDESGNDKMLSLCSELSLEHKYIGLGDSVPFGNTGATFRVIGPKSLNSADENDNSLVLTLKVNGRTLLFTGDMQFAEEEEVMETVGENGVDCDILKVGNHGNKDATSDAFAAAASPSTAIISTSTDADKNSASKRVRKLLSSTNLYITENFENGLELKISADGEISTFELLSGEDESDTDYYALEISKPDAKTQSFTVTNNGEEEINLRGCFVYLGDGEKIFRFGDYTLSGGDSAVVVCKGGDTSLADMVWNESFAINTKKEKRAVLYDAFGNPVCETRTDISG